MHERLYAILTATQCLGNISHKNAFDTRLQTTSYQYLILYITIMNDVRSSSPSVIVDKAAILAVIDR